MTAPTPDPAADVAPACRRGARASGPGEPVTPPPGVAGGKMSQAPVTAVPDEQPASGPATVTGQTPAREGRSASLAGSQGLSGAEWRKAVKDAQAKGRRKTAGKRPATSPALPLVPPDPDGCGLAATAHCAGCDWTAAGTPAEVDRAADKHTKAGHSTGTVMLPVRRTA